MFGFLYTSYHCTAFAPKTAFSCVLLPVMYFLLYGFLRGLQILLCAPGYILYHAAAVHILADGHLLPVSPVALLCQIPPFVLNRRRRSIRLVPCCRPLFGTWDSLFYYPPSLSRCIMSYTNPVLRCISNFFRQLIIVLPYIYAAVPLLHSLWNWCTALRSDSWRIFPDHSCIPGIRHGLLYGILTAGIQDISHNNRTHRKHTSTAFYGLRTLVGCGQNPPSSNIFLQIWGVLYAASATTTSASGKYSVTLP